MVVVAAGTKGIGHGIAKAFYEAGAKVAVFGRSPDRIAQLKDSFSDQKRFFALPGDIKDKEFIEDFFKQSTEYFNCNCR